MSPDNPPNRDLYARLAVGNSATVPATGVNVELYDANGDDLTTVFVPLGLQGIAPGVTVTNVSTPGAATIPANTASCQATTYNTS